MSRDYSQKDIDNRADQLNPNNDAYWSSRDEEREEDERSQEDIDNRADQLNPNNDAYWSSRGGR